jgi:hypothetical protein
MPSSSSNKPLGGLLQSPVSFKLAKASMINWMLGGGCLSGRQNNGNGLLAFFRSEGCGLREGKTRVQAESTEQMVVKGCGEAPTRQLRHDRGRDSRALLFLCHFGLVDIAAHRCLWRLRKVAFQQQKTRWSWHCSAKDTFHRTLSSKRYKWASHPCRR